MKERIPFQSLTWLFVILSFCSSVLLLGCSSTNSPQIAPIIQTAPLPRPNHIVVVIEENHTFSEIIGSTDAPYINSLANEGALLTQSFAVTHPSEPNYLVLFSGSTQGIADDSCPHTFAGPDLGGELLAAHETFAGFSEGLPHVGSTACTSGEYVRRHAPWVNFSDIPARDNLPLTSFPAPAHFDTLPTISFVIPNVLNDMHDGSIQQGDHWLKQHLDPFVQWAKTHNSLLIVTWDEDDGWQDNRIPTIFVGPMVKVGQYNESLRHENVLRTLEGMYGLPAAHQSIYFSPVSDCWQKVQAIP